MGHPIEINVKAAAQAEELADRFSLEPSQIAEEAIAFVSHFHEAFETWLSGRKFTLALETTPIPK